MLRDSSQLLAHEAARLLSSAVVASITDAAHDSVLLASASTAARRHPAHQMDT